MSCKTENFANSAAKLSRKFWEMEYFGDKKCRNECHTFCKKGMRKFRVLQCNSGFAGHLVCLSHI